MPSSSCWRPPPSGRCEQQSDGADCPRSLHSPSTSVRTRSGPSDLGLAQSCDGFTITSTGRIGAPIDLVIREFKARYDASWKPLELTIDASVRGQGWTLHTTVSDTTAATELTGAPGTQPLRRTDTVDAQALFMPNPFIAPYEAVAARAAAAPSGTSLSLYQPGQGTFTAVVGESATEQIQTVERVIAARRTAVTFQAAGAPPIETEIWSDENGRLLRLRIPSQQLEVALKTWPRCQPAGSPSRARTTKTCASRPTASGLPERCRSRKARRDRCLRSFSSPDRDRPIATRPWRAFPSSASSPARWLMRASRCFGTDKRGVGQSGGRVESASLADYAEDVRAAVRMMTDRKDVDRRRIAVVGHSEGGALALVAASKEKRIAALGLLATIGMTGADLNMYQVTHALERSNRSEAERQNTIELQRQIQQAVLTGKGVGNDFDSACGAAPGRDPVVPELSRLRPCQGHAGGRSAAAHRPGGARYAGASRKR